MTGCAERGEQLAPYVDGELDALAAEAFSLHLAACAACRAGLHDALQLVAVEARAARAGASAGLHDALQLAAVEARAARAGVSAGERVRPPEPRASDAATRSRRRRWRRHVGLALAVAAAAVVVLVAIRLIGRDGAGSGERDAPVVLATADVRSLEGRVSYAAADRHRPYRVVRAAGAEPADRIGLDRLAELERRGDLHGVAAAYLLLGDTMRATAYLERAAAGPDVAADRALVLLLTGHPADAIVALDGVLAAAPRHPQALWNRALALRALGLARMAVEAFDAVAALGEPGWSDEARARGKALAAQTDARQHLAEQLLAAGPKLATAPGGISADLARQIPGSARVYLYDAVRGATSPAGVRALAPLAQVLDAVAGDHALISYIDQIARADFTRRGPLAARYARVAAGEQLDPRATREFLEALRLARQDDILFGALLLTNPDRRTVPPAYLPEYRELATRTGERWFRLLSVEQEAGALVARGEFAAAEALVLPELSACARHELDFRCARLDLALGESYLATLRLSDARRVTHDGIARTTRAGEWWLEQRFLPQLADLEMQTDDVRATTLPLARAYLGELMHRDPRCATEVWSREELATLLINREDFRAAREELDRATALGARCPAARPLVRSVFVRAQVASDDQIASVRADIATLRSAPTTTAADQAVLDETEGRLLLGRDRAAGIALLERAIATASPLAQRDIDAQKAKSYAYANLVLDAGLGGDWSRVWRLLSEEIGGSVERCGLGLAVERHRSVAVIRTSDGAVAGVYQADRAQSDLDVAGLVPAQLFEQLRRCSEIDVLARPPTQGTPALLRPDVAWSYRLAGRAPGTGRAGGRRLVVSNAEPPVELGLARLAPWHSADVPDVAIEGPAATPAHVLAAVGDASFIEIHAHGVVNTAVSDAASIMLSPDPDGRFALTAAAIRQRPLRGLPIVILAACHAGATASYRHEPWGLPAAFIAAGARAVIASPEVIADRDAGPFFDALRARIERGASPARALRDQRLEWLAAHPDAAWLRSLMVFQ